MPGVYYTPFKDAGLYAEGLLDLYIGIFQAADVFPEENEALAEAPLGRQIKGLAKLPALLDAVEVAKNSYLYQKIGSMGEHLKFGITKNPLTRYSSEELGGGRLRILASGSREEMLRLERNLHSTLPIGPQERQLFYIQQQVSKGLLAPPY